jgi:hypothetical protein
VDDAEIIEQLTLLAREAGLAVRTVRGLPQAEGEPAAGSAVCRVRGQTWVVLSGADAPARRVDVLCQALRRFAPDLLEGRWLPPALRLRLAASEDSA